MAKAQRFTVLVATDDSDVATAAVEAATIFPWPAATRVHAVIVRSAAKLVDVPDNLSAQIDAGFAAAAERARKILARRWPDAEARVVDGPTVDAILARASQVGAKVIVLGSQGHGPIARLLIGSVSLGVVRRMKCAALVVRSRPRAFTRFVVGLDGSAHANRTVAFLAALPAPAGGQLTIVCVHEPIKVPSTALIPSAARAAVKAQAAKENAAGERRIQREMDTAAARLRRAGWKVDGEVRQGTPLPSLLAAAKSARAHLVAVGARGTTGVERLLMGSVCEGALNTAPMSVLVVR